jgi:hypothetical protein
MNIINTTNKEFNFLYSLPDSILMEAYELLFVKYRMYNNLKLFLELKNNNQYEIIRHTAEKNYGRESITCYKKSGIYPSIHIEYDHNYINGKGELTLPFFDEEQLYNRYILFNDYYGICFSLIRKITINDVLN